MTVMTQIILAVALVLSIIVPFGYYFIGEKSVDVTKQQSQQTHFSSLVPC